MFDYYQRRRINAFSGYMAGCATFCPVLFCVWVYFTGNNVLAWVVCLSLMIVSGLGGLGAGILGVAARSWVAVVCGIWACLLASGVGFLCYVMATYE